MRDMARHQLPGAVAVLRGEGIEYRPVLLHGQLMPHAGVRQELQRGIQFQADPLERLEHELIVGCFRDREVKGSVPPHEFGIVACLGRALDDRVDLVQLRAPQLRCR